MKALEAIKILLTSDFRFSPVDLALLEEVIEVRILKKNDFFLKPGKICTRVAFLNYGILRVFQLVDAKDITSYFSYPDRNRFVASFRSFVTQTPATEYIEALSDCELIVIKYVDIQKLYQKNAAFNRLGRELAEHNFLLAVARIESLQYQNATDRYNDFLNTYPSLLNLIPHHYIASYLGITPESLSRIRKG